jgi:hypothetical protein
VHVGDGVGDGDTGGDGEVHFWPEGLHEGVVDGLQFWKKPPWLQVGVGFGLGLQNGPAFGGQFGLQFWKKP